VARTLRKDGASPKKQDLLKNQDSLLNAQKDVWGGTVKEEQASIRGDPLLIDEDGFIVGNDTNNGDFVDPFAPTNNQEDLFAPNNEDPFANTFFSSTKKDTKRKVKRRPSAESSTSQQVARVVEAPKNTVISSNDSRESRIDAVEMATKKRIEMLRKLVEYRARTMSSDEDSASKDELQKLDFVEAETMKQIARLRDRLGESRRKFGGV
jgi:hypothetical protein